MLAQADRETFVDLVGEAEIGRFLLQHGGELRFELLELLDIALEEIDLGRVQVLEKAAEEPPGNLFVKPGLVQVALLQEIADHLGQERVLLAKDRLRGCSRRQQQQSRNGCQDVDGFFRWQNALDHGR